MRTDMSRLDFDDVELEQLVNDNARDSPNGEERGDSSEYCFCVRGRCLTGPPPSRTRWSLFQYFAQMVSQDIPFQIVYMYGDMN